jgi:hypothetical protein
MPIFKLQAYESKIIRYEVDYRIFRFIVESDEKVTVYLVAHDEAMKFKRGESFRSYFKTKEKYYHKDVIRLPYSGDWYLIIYNPNNTIAAVSYDVF